MIAATVNSAGVGTPPRSILRIVSSASPDRAASSRTGISPRARRSAAPSASPRARSNSLNASRTTVGSYPTPITIPG